ncbi:MAG: RNA-binding protein [Candidatus Margulisbacteria bacterium]|nr:RNA-binding protein [Candidatus Margulisiibacteriota bacterium]
MDIYVGNLKYEVRENDLQEMFSEFGEVSKVKIVKDRDTDRSKGFGFVTMDDTAEATAAITALNGKDLNGRAITVNAARPK